MACLSVRQLAERWGYKYDTIYKGIKNEPNKWPPYRQVKDGSKIMFDLKDVQAFENKTKKKKIIKNNKK